MQFQLPCEHIFQVHEHVIVKLNKLKLNCLQIPGFGKGHQSYQNNVLMITWPYLSALSLSSLKCTCLGKKNVVSHEFK